MTIQPTNLSLSEGVLTIAWSDGASRQYGLAELRNACPCATCNTERERTEEGVFDPAAMSPGLGIRRMQPVGNYAYSILFSDGHDTGIYTLEMLRQLGRKTG